MVSLAKLAGATILPLFCFSNSDGQTTLILESPIPLDLDDSRKQVNEKALMYYADLLESYIRRYPDQYRNWHLVGAK
jgi:lauroyl/myristoyl acyltransferase